MPGTAPELKSCRLIDLPRPPTGKNQGEPRRYIEVQGKTCVDMVWEQIDAMAVGLRAWKG